MSRRRELTPEGADALARAQAVTDEVRDARAAMRTLAAARRDAVLFANEGGASYGVIARTIGRSVGNVQQIVIAARKDEGRS